MTCKHCIEYKLTIDKLNNDIKQLSENNNKMKDYLVIFKNKLNKLESDIKYIINYLM